MTGSNIYFDTAPFIYLVEGHQYFATPVAQFIQQNVLNGSLFSTSVLTVMEFNVKPLQLERTDIIQEFDDLLSGLKFTIQPVTIEIAREAARLRTKHSFLKGIDALHISTAKSLGCQAFLTSDEQLSRVIYLNLFLLSALI